MKEIESTDAMAMQPSDLKTILDDLNDRRSRIPLALVFPLLIGLALFPAFSVGDQRIGYAVLGLAVLFFFFGRWMDNYRRAAVLFYDLDDRQTRAYAGLIEIFEDLQKTASTWHISSKGDIHDWNVSKRHGGAAALIERKPTRIAFRLPKTVKSNLTPASINVGRQNLYFFPDMVLIEERGFGAVRNDDLRLVRENSRMIEDEKVPRDTTVVGETWKHPNKSGGPDRRFAQNRRLPVCLYDRLHIHSESGLNEVVQFSRPQASSLLVRYVDAYVRFTLARELESRQ